MRDLFRCWNINDGFPSACEELAAGSPGSCYVLGGTSRSAAEIMMRTAEDSLRGQTGQDRGETLRVTEEGRTEETVELLNKL